MEYIHETLQIAYNEMMCLEKQRQLWLLWFWNHPLLLKIHVVYC